MNRRIVARAVLVASAAWAGSPAAVFSCSTCFGQADGPMIDAARVGTFLLLGVVLGLQAAFAAFFLYLRRQAARAGQDAVRDDWVNRPRAGSGEWRSA